MFLTQRTLLERLIWLVVISGLLAVGLVILLPFLGAIFWGWVLALITWPLFLWLKQRLKHKGWVALILTVSLALSLAIPVIFLASALVSDTTKLITTVRIDGQTLAQIPILGPQLVNRYEKIRQDLPQLLTAQGENFTLRAVDLSQQILNTLFTLGLAFLTCYFLYLKGERYSILWDQSLKRLGGEPLHVLFQPLVPTVRAVILGLCLTALVQGSLGTLGFALVGVEGAVLCGTLITLASLFQIPTLVVWLPVTLWLVLQGRIIPALIVVAWSQLVIVPVGNILKPALISQGTGLPFVGMFLSVLGGLLAFGPPGLVLGPVLLSLLINVWHRWIIGSLR